MKSYQTVVALGFPCPAERVYGALIDLKTYPKWNTGMLKISSDGPMTIGLCYETENALYGNLVGRSQIEVTRLVPGSGIELVNVSGPVSFRALFNLNETRPGYTELVLNLSFEFNSLILDLARPAVESMAKSRITGDLEHLREMITA